MTETELKQYEAQNLKLQLISHALKLSNNYTVNDLIKNTDKLFKYVTKEESITDYSDKIYEKFGLTSPKSNPDYEKGTLEEAYEKCDDSPKKCLDIELDCQDIKFEKCDCTTECPPEEIEPWNTEEFKLEYKDFLDKLLILDAGHSGIRMFFNNKTDKYIISDEYLEIKKKYEDMFSNESVRKDYYKLLTTRDWNRENIHNFGTPPDYARPCSFNEIAENYKKMRESKNKEDLFDSYIKEVYEPFNGKSQIKSLPKKKFSFFDEWCKERELKLSKQEVIQEEQQLLLDL